MGLSEIYFHLLLANKKKRVFNLSEGIEYVLIWGGRG